MSTPNTALKAARMGRLLSQDDLARALRDAGAPSASKRLVQRWESGCIATPRPSHARALEQVLRLPIEALGFTTPMPVARVSDDGQGGHDLAPAPSGIPPASDTHLTQGAPAAGRGSHTGIWLSRYEYFSSDRGQSFASHHYVVVLQHGSRLTVSSLPRSAPSTLTMDMEVDGTVITGTWSENTDPTGHYQGARYHGAIQLLVEPTGRRMVGKWVGFGKTFDVNTGPWELIFQDASTTKTTISQYNRPPEG